MTGAGGSPLFGFVQFEFPWELGPVPDEDLATFYRMARVYISLSEHEGFCVPLVESFHMGVPVLALSLIADSPASFRQMVSSCRSSSVSAGCSASRRATTSASQPPRLHVDDQIGRSLLQPEVVIVAERLAQQPVV